MGVPKKHKTSGSTRQRRNSHALKAKSFAKCQNCGAATMAHKPCPNCGYYKSRKVVR